VVTEIRKARAQEKKANRRKLFPYLGYDSGSARAGRFWTNFAQVVDYQRKKF
jgi:hypothetical protein